MGFYGNITNTSKTQFQFDRIYPNRATMENKKNIDNIYAGRFVLIEYDKNIEVEGFNRAWEKSEGGKSVFYSSNTFENVTRYNKNNTEKGYIVFTSDKDLQPSEQLVYKNCKFYVCESTLDVNDSTPAEWRELVKSDNPYTMNYTIDTEAYGPSRGYDSTVWQKTYVDGRDKYVQIAELNSVVPTFDISADAPTMNPIVPHFDINSTNVYYKLHMQPQWGFRVAAADENLSDEKVTWTTTTYDPKTDKTTSVDNNNVNGAIYYNKEAFDKQLNQENIHKKDEDTLNSIKIIPTGESGNKYNVHDKTGAVASAKDIQELTINLPAIGNMMSDAWDIIHGPNRDNARTDDNSSLQGRLDSFKEIEANQIPVKRAEDGTLVGSMINSAIAYNNWEDKPNDILQDDGITPAFARDDAWIETVIDTSDLVGGVKDGDDIDQSANSGISIHHTFHPTENSFSTVDKNTGEMSESETYKSDYIRSTNKHHNENDDIDLYVPYVDAKGHVVGHNIETITLPYSYRFFEARPVAGISDEDLYTKVTNNTDGDNTSEIIDAAESSLSADKTQDTFTFKPYNKWIQLQLNNTDDSLTIAHEIHAVNEVKRDSDLNDGTDTITIQDTEFDDAGHIIENHKHTYILPYGYKKFITNGRNNNEIDNNQNEVGETETTASNTQDTVAVNSGNYWVRVDIKDDDITLSHSVRDITETSNGTENLNKESGAKNENNINIPDWTYDKAGHIRSKQDHFYTLPFGYKTITTNGRSNEVSENATGTPSKVNIVADDTQDSLAINSGNKWVRIDTNATDDILEIRHNVHTPELTKKEDTDLDGIGAFEVQDIQFDEAGHMTHNQVHKYILPHNFRNINISSSNSVNAGQNQDGKVEANDYKGEFNLTTQNRWINLNANINNDTISIGHAAAGGTTITTAGDTNSETPKFGSQFTIPYVKYDEMGHITEKGTRNITIPKGSLDYKTLEGNNANVLTSINYTPETGLISVTNQNAGQLILTDFNRVNENSAWIQATDSINQAFNKIDTRLDGEINRASGAEQTLTTNLNNEISRAKEAEEALTTNLNNEVNRAKGEESRIEGIINQEIENRKTITDTLGTAATTNVEAYATSQQGALADSALQLNTEYKESTIEKLLDLIISLNEKVDTLEKRINELHPPVEEEETPIE